MLSRFKNCDKLMYLCINYYGIQLEVDITVNSLGQRSTNDIRISVMFYLFTEHECIKLHDKII